MFSLCCVVQNLLMRGKRTTPSVFLQEKLEGRYRIPYESGSWETVFTVVDEPAIWRNRIKGNEENGDNPASNFFHDILPDIRREKDWRFVTNLILPETPFSEIDGIKEKEFVDQQVDFYLPQAKIVIEIDGSQHRKQIDLDRKRDAALKNAGVKVIRIPTSDIRNNTSSLERKVNEFYQHCKECKALIEYHDRLGNNYGSVEAFSLRKRYDCILRFEILLLCMAKCGMIDLDAPRCRIRLAGDGNWADLLLAWQDLRLWLENLSILAGIQFHMPLLEKANSEGEDAVVDFSYDLRWTDENEYSPDTVYVRNDYFDAQDYFRVQTAKPINYIANDVLEEGSGDRKLAVEKSMCFFLKNLFGYDAFNPKQADIIAHALSRRTTIGILPTGSGKSLCYQMTVYLQPCISFSVCPITSLIVDQKKNLDEKGMDRTGSIFYNEKNRNESYQVQKEFSEKKLQLIWISPERFQNQNFREALSKINTFGYAVIDEVHCLSEWGHDFRTAYLMLVKSIRQFCSGAVLLGLTATASQIVRDDIRREFGCTDYDAVITPNRINREELKFHVVKTKPMQRRQSLERILEDISNRFDEDIFQLHGEDTKCGIIFTILKSEKKDLGARNLAGSFGEKGKKNGWEATVYDSDTDDRLQVQKDFMDNKFPVLFATKAFGMGVNKRNIRYTIHYGMPWSVEAFYQEAGRAGRDSKKENKESHCYILYDEYPGERNELNEIFGKEKTMEEVSFLQTKINQYVDISSILFLWKRNNEGVETELETMRWIGEKIFKGQDTISVDEYITDRNKRENEENRDIIKSRLEKGLYRLSLLGMCNDWTVESWSKGHEVFKVRSPEIPRSAEQTKERMLEYIRRYESGFTLDDQQESYRKYREIIRKDEVDNKPIRGYMRCLLQWTYDNVVYNRKSAIQGMMQLLDEFEITKDENAFKEEIEKRFSITDFDDILRRIVNAPYEVSQWREALEYSERNQSLARLRQYIEDYRNNPGLNYTYAMLQLLKGNANAIGIQDRLSDAFDSIRVKSDHSDELIDFSIELLQSTSIECRDVLGEALMIHYADRAEEIQRKLKDRASQRIILKKALIQLQKYERSL